MKKIIVDKADGIAEVIDQILNERDDEVTVVIPRGSALVRSASNFRLLKREADGAGKDVAVESVDDTVLAFAKECGLQAVHPLWHGVRTADEGISDIVPKSRPGSSPDMEEEHAASPAKRRKLVVKEEPSREEEEEDEVEYDEVDEEEEEETEERETDEEEVKRPNFFSSSPRGFGAAVRNGMDNMRRRNDDRGRGDDDDDDDNGPRRRIGGRVWAIIAIVVILVLAGAWIASAYFNHANVSITFKKTPWTWQGALTVDKAASADNLAGGVLAGQVFTSNKNITDTFPASGKQDVSLKAQGTITIYNDYSTKSQELIVNTRFLTPSGKIFRITKSVTVPGATQGANGQLQASSIQAAIVADQAGPDYNIGPVAKLTIPGFQGDPQYNGFWGTITASTTGGFTGMKAVPTAADISAAEASTTADLQASLNGGFNGSYPNNFKILDGATQTQTGQLTVNTTTDASGNFTVFGTATLSAIGFDESALKTALLAEAQATYPSSTFADITLNYSNVNAAFSKGQVSLSLGVQADLEPAFSPVDFEQQILGKSVTDARTTIAALPQLSSAEISVWPSWLWAIPSDPAKVHITVD